MTNLKVKQSQREWATIIRTSRKRTRRSRQQGKEEEEDVNRPTGKHCQKMAQMALASNLTAFGVNVNKIIAQRHLATRGWSEQHPSRRLPLATPPFGQGSKTNETEQQITMNINIRHLRNSLDNRDVP